MTEATWGDDTATPAIDWRMSVALENVPRGEEDLAEVTSLESAVRTWAQLDPAHQHDAVITFDHPLLIDGTSHASLGADGIADLLSRLPKSPDDAANTP